MTTSRSTIVRLSAEVLGPVRLVVNGTPIDLVDHASAACSRCW